MNTNQTTVYMVIGAILVGVYLGGTLILSLVKVLSTVLRPPQPPPYYDNNGYPPDYQDNRGRGSGCLLVIILGIVGLVIFNQFADSKFVKAILDQTGGQSDTLEAPMQSQKNRYERMMDEAISEMPKPTQLPETETPEPASTAEENIGSGESFVVRIGAFSQKEGAKAVFQAHSQKDYPVGFFTKEGLPEQTLFVIIVGENLTKSAAQALLTEVNIPGAMIIPANDLDLHYSAIDL